MGWFNEALGLSPIKTTNVDTSEYSSMGKDFLNPNSSRNRGMYNNLKQMGVDAIAQQYLNGARMGAMGQNPFANQQMRSGLSNNLAQTQQAYNGYLNNAYTTGSGLMGQALQGDMANAQAQNMAICRRLKTRASSTAVCWRRLHRHFHSRCLGCPEAVPEAVP